VGELAPLKARVQACLRGRRHRHRLARLELNWGGVDYLDLKTNWPMAEVFERKCAISGRDFFPMKDIPPGFAGSTDMGNVSHRVASIHPMLAVAPAGVIIHNPEFRALAASEQGDAAVIDGAKAMALNRPRADERRQIAELRYAGISRRRRNCPGLPSPRPATSRRFIILMRMRECGCR